MAAQTQELTRQEAKEPSRLTALGSLLERFKAQIAVALPKHMTPERMIRVGLSAVSGNKLLMQCDQLSVAACIVQASILGLEPNAALGEAYLIPFWNKKADKPGGGKGAYQCQLMIGYKGLVKLARNSGQLSTVDAQPVYGNDTFEFQKGSDTWWRHTWNLTGERGPILGYWAGFKLKDGSSNFEYWTVQQIEEHRDKYSTGAYNQDNKLQGPWKDSPDWMFRKTPLRQVLKLAPQSVELQTALSLDERHEIGKTQAFSIDVPLELQPPPTDEDDGDDVPSSTPTPTIAAPKLKPEGAQTAPPPAAEPEPTPAPAAAENATLDPNATITDARADEVRAAMDASGIPQKDRAGFWKTFNVPNPYSLTNAQADLAMAELQRKAK